MNKITRITVAALVGVSLFAGTAGVASAETITRPAGVRQATIKPSTNGVPAGAKVTSKTITVKKGTKTVARNKTSYKAWPGTYKVTSTIKYKPRVTHIIPKADVFAECRVTSRKITSDRTELHYNYDGGWQDYDYDGYDDEYVDGTYWASGQVTVQYTGTCENSYPTRKFYATWTEDDYVMTEDAPYESNWNKLILAETYYGIGDVSYVSGSDLVGSAKWYTYGSTKTLKKTRTVTVR